MIVSIMSLHTTEYYSVGRMVPERTCLLSLVDAVIEGRHDPVRSHFEASGVSKRLQQCIKQSIHWMPSR